MIHRTLLITQSFPPQQGGIERYLSTVCKGLAPDALTVVTPPFADDAAFDRQQRYRIIRKDLLRHSFIRPAWVWHVWWVISTIRFFHISRIVFGHYASWVSVGVIAKMLVGTPYSIVFHGLDFTSYRTSAIRRFFLKINTRGAEWILVNSRYTYDLLRNLGVPSGKLIIAHPSIDAPSPQQPEDIAAFKLKYRLPERYGILTVARLVRRKGHARVMQALPAILRTYPDACYVIVGNGPEHDSLVQQAKRLDVLDNVRFLNKISDDERNLAYASAEVFALVPLSTPQDPEGFGIAFLEALSFGLPLVATLTAGTNDIVRDEFNGRALNEKASAEDIERAIRSLFEDPAHAQQLGKNGMRDVLSRFSSVTLLSKFNTVLAEPEKKSQLASVSVIVPAWNGAETIARTLHSIDLQTWKNIEVIVVDDGSTDATDAVCKKFPHVRYLRQDHSGAPRARNTGYAASDGEFVLFCDADVTLHPRMIERMVTTLRLQPDASYAYCNFRFGWRTFDLFDYDSNRLKKSNYISMMSLIRREAFPGFDESLKRLQDWDLWLTMLERSQTGVWVPARLFSASIGQKGISAKVTRPPLEAVSLIKHKHGIPL